jgi:DNA polymerase III subunit epsilon
MRLIALDTETTGLDPATGDRVIEIGCVEVINGIPTGVTFQCYLNPEREVPAAAFAIHGLSGEFLADKPRFAEVAEEFITFIGDAPLIAHNASFDIGFINAELARVTRGPIGADRVVDTLLLARRKHPGGSNRLDDLCARYGIDNSKRTRHGALLDAQILAAVYVELVGERQATLGLTEDAVGRAAGGARVIIVRPQPLPARLTADERAAHLAFVATLGEKPIWNDYLEQAGAAA